VKLDLGSFLLQWSTGGLAGLWVTVRRRELGIGYGWLLRITYGLLGAGAVAALASRHHGAAAAVAAALVVATIVALVVSVRVRRDGPVAFDHRFDISAPILGAIGLAVAAASVGGPYALALARLVVGAVFLGFVTDAMLLGHWYLVQPGLRRDPLIELVRLTTWVWPLEVLVMLLPTGMISVINGSIDDGYHGLLAWVWVACAIATVGLVAVTRLALRERYYSAVMSATGLLYLAILTAFGTDLVARAVLSP
jgi:hypothetical protein